MATLRSVGSLHSVGSLRSIGSMHTISEGYATLATPVSESVSSSTSSEELGGDVTVFVDPMHFSDGVASDSSARAASDTSSTSTKMNNFVSVTMSIVIGAYFGVGIRVLLTEFANVMYERQTELLKLLGFSFFLPNVFGCFVMGLATRTKLVLRGQYDVLLSGITTGFCGCCTTFASWDVGAALMFVEGRWLNAILMVCIQVASAIASLRLGFHVAEGMLHYLTLQNYPFRKPLVDLVQLNLDLEKNINHFRETKMHTFGPLVTRRVHATEESLAIARDSCNELMAEIAQVEREQYTIQHRSMIWIVAALSLTALFWSLAFCGLDNYPSSRLLAICVGPFGALLRWYLSLYNGKSMCKRFPLFTFLPNVVASCLNCAMEIVGSVVYQGSASAYQDFIMWGQGCIMVGFLGSLSTVSTWVNELDNLSSKRLYWAYRYGLASFIVSQLASVFILGMYDAYGSNPLIG